MIAVYIVAGLATYVLLMLGLARFFKGASPQLRRSAPVPPVEPTAARRPETPIRAAGTNLNGRWTPAVFYDFDEAVEDYINTPNVLDQRDAVKRVRYEASRLLAALDNNK